MLLIDSTKYNLDYDKFMALMRESTKVYLGERSFKREAVRTSARYEGLKELAMDYMSAVSGTIYRKINNNIVKDFLIRYEGVPSSEFEILDKGQISESFDVNVRERLIQKGYAPELLQIFNDLSEISSVSSTGSSWLRAMRKFGNAKTNDGDNLMFIPFRYGVAETYRIYTRNQSVQGLPLCFSEELKAPKDYFIFSGDLSQIDFRVAWNLILRYYYGDTPLESSKESKDYYEKFARLMNETLGKTFNKDDFIRDRHDYKEGILATVYGGNVQTLHDSIPDLGFCSTMYNYINSPDNKGYSKYKSLIEESINSNVPFSCYSYFGKEMFLDTRQKDALNAALNRPIQSTSADIIEIITMEMVERLRKHTKNKMLIFPLVNRHDETLFLVHKSLIPHMYEILNCCEMQIDDWDLIEMKWTAGYKYSVPDEDLIESIKESWKNAPPEYKVEQKPIKVNKKYTPFTNTILLNYVELRDKYDCFYLIQDCNNGKNRSIIGQSYTGNTLTSIYELIKEEWSDLFKDITNLRFVLQTNTEEDYIKIDGVELIKSNLGRTALFGGALRSLAYVFGKWITKTKGREPSPEIQAQASSQFYKEMEVTWKI